MNANGRKSSTCEEENRNNEEICMNIMCMWEHEDTKGGKHETV